MAQVHRLQIVPGDQKHVGAQFVEMKVPLYSYGCEKKVKKALSHLRGIHSVHVDYYQQKVTVWGICNKEDILATVRKKRREARFWEEKPAGTAEGEVASPPKMEEDNAAATAADSDSIAADVKKSHKGWKPWKKRREARSWEETPAGTAEGEVAPPAKMEEDNAAAAAADLDCIAADVKESHKRRKPWRKKLFPLGLY